MCNTNNRLGCFARWWNDSYSFTQYQDFVRHSVINFSVKLLCFRLLYQYGQAGSYKQEPTNEWCKLLPLNYGSLCIRRLRVKLTRTITYITITFHSLRVWDGIDWLEGKVLVGYNRVCFWWITITWLRRLKEEVPWNITSQR